MKIQFEIEQIENLIGTYSDLLEICSQKAPNKVEIAALGSVLHSFYNGLENIFSVIAKEVDGILPQGFNWHKDLLIQISNKTTSRNAVISDTTREKLVNFLGFRHFFRHSYSFFLDWNELKPLVGNLKSVWKEVRESLEKIA
ncbi:MAG: hypothetical protein ACOYXC_20370 [Candidatus Rifleibacteriota bacterium]